jgi:ectoine hydroxylase-related dioxygenase (phytanoyl-CoA dioxygenase family)
MTPIQALGTGLTVEQTEFYRDEGYLVLNGLLNDADLAGAQEAMEQKVEEIARDMVSTGACVDDFRHAAFDQRLALLFAGRSDDEFLKFGRSWRERRAGYFNLMANRKILDAVECLIGGEIFANPVYNTRPKVPGVAAGAVPWHQDKSYWPGANSNPVITVWIPLVDATMENGCLHVWPRTHRTPVLSYHTELITGTGYTELDERHLQRHRKRTEPVPLPVSRGSAILFNDRCIHSSTPNLSDRVRWSVDLRYQPVDQDPMTSYGVGFLARSRRHPQAVASLEDWLQYRPEHIEG